MKGRAVMVKHIHSFDAEILALTLKDLKEVLKKVQEITPAITELKNETLKLQAEIAQNKAQIEHNNSLLQANFNNLEMLQRLARNDEALLEQNTQHLQTISDKLSGLDTEKLDRLSASLGYNLDTILTKAEEVVDKLESICTEFSDDEPKKYEEASKALLFSANRYSGIGKSEISKPLLNMANDLNRMQSAASTRRFTS